MTLDEYRLTELIFPPITDAYSTACQVGLGVVYAHAFPSDDRDAAERVAAVMFGT